ncbi:MAG: enolase C-terminal domain-like protein, partial [Thermodesulfobacteriota bacterium]
MIIKEIKNSIITLPFRFSYGHKQKTHKEVFANICQMTDEGDNTGLGESVPRTYVTGETAETVLADTRKLGGGLLGKSFSSYAEVQAYMETLSKEWPPPFPSCAFSAVDIALHDTVARSLGKDMATYFGTKPVKTQYTGSIGISNKANLLTLITLYRIGGIREFKLKVGDEADLDRLATIKSVLGSETRVFADANGAWTPTEAPGKITALAEAGIWAIEEPLKIPIPKAPGEDKQIDREGAMNDLHFERYARLRKEIPIPVILDESLISPRSFSKILKHDAADILNIRLSKLGGFSLVPKMLTEKPAHMKFSMCAMVGESPILAAAGYFFGCAHPERLYTQGYSHRIL